MSVQERHLTASGMARRALVYIGKEKSKHQLLINKLPDMSRKTPLFTYFQLFTDSGITASQLK